MTIHCSSALPWKQAHWNWPFRSLLFLSLCPSPVNWLCWVWTKTTDYKVMRKSASLHFWTSFFSLQCFKVYFFRRHWETAWVYRKDLWFSPFNYKVTGSFCSLSSWILTLVKVFTIIFTILPSLHTCSESGLGYVFSLQLIKW